MRVATLCCLFVHSSLLIVLRHVFRLLLNTGSYQWGQASKVWRPVYKCLAS